MQSYAYSQTAGIWTQGTFKLTGHHRKLAETVLSKTCHENRVVFLRIWEAGDGDVTVLIVAAAGIAICEI